MRNIRRNAAVIASTAVIASVSIGGVMAAHANDTKSPDQSTVQTPGDGAEETADGPDQGPDANPNEPGHQDANEAGEADEADGAEEAEGAEETEGAEEAADGPDQGPDANPNEPGHQDANEDGESN